MINKVILVGRLGKDPEIRNIEGGSKVANFTLATSESFKDKNDAWQEKTEWHRIVMWRFLADRAEKYLHKGSLIYVEGKITTRQYDDKEGNKKYITEIVAETMRMLDGKSSDQGSNTGSVVSSNTATDETTNQTDDLPF